MLVNPILPTCSCDSLHSIIPISRSVVPDPDYHKTTCLDFNRIVLEKQSHVILKNFPFLHLKFQENL